MLRERSYGPACATSSTARGCGDVLVQPGDTIFADVDGVEVMPRERLATVVELACDKAGKESLSRRDPKAGLTLRAVDDRHGVP